MGIDRYGVSKKSKKPWEQDYGPDWETQRERCLRRDNYCCRECKKSVKGTSRRAVHHIVSRSKGGTNSLSNLMTICHDCHVKEHPHMQDWERKKKQKAEFQPVKKSTFFGTPLSKKSSTKSYHARKSRSLW